MAKLKILNDKIYYNKYPIKFMLSRYDKLKEALDILFAKQEETYISGIYIVAPRPTTFKILLINNQSFYLIWTGITFIAKIKGGKYYLDNTSDVQRALYKIVDLLTIGMPVNIPQSEQQGELPEMAGSFGAESMSSPVSPMTGNPQSNLPNEINNAFEAGELPNEQNESSNFNLLR